MEDLTKFFKSAFSVDNVIFGFDGENLKVLLIKRKEDPFNGRWALPGDLVYPQEDLSTAANRVLEQLTGLKDVYLEQVRTFGRTDRHPLGRVITIAYYSLVKISNYNPKPSSFAQIAAWVHIGKANDLAFDHDEIFQSCFKTLQNQVRSRPIGFELLPKQFTLSKLQQLYETILNTALDKRNFRKKILSMDILVDLGEYQKGVAHRPAKLYQFDPIKYNIFLEEGYSFELKVSKTTNPSADMA